MKFKKLLAMLMVTSLAMSAAACGDKPADGGNAGDTTQTQQSGNDGGDAAAATDGKVLNIYCWNEEFKTRVTDHYPGYTATDAVTGSIGDVTVKWNITPNADNAYQNNLDATLAKQNDAKADDKIDIFLIEADYALKYVDTEYTMAVKDLGITDADIANQYKYTQDVVTDSNGVLKGLSWQGCPGILFRLYTYIYSLELVC